MAPGRRPSPPALPSPPPRFRRPPLGTPVPPGGAPPWSEAGLSRAERFSAPSEGPGRPHPPPALPGRPRKQWGGERRGGRKRAAEPGGGRGRLGRPSSPLTGVAPRARESRRRSELYARWLPRDRLDRFPVPKTMAV